jgi:hypothetical protein
MAGDIILERRARSNRNAEEIIADSQATSPGIRRHALLALDVPPEAQESGGAELSGGAP